MTLCADCPSTSTPPPSCPEPPDGSNCCLRIRYVCVDGTWTLDTDYSECVDNTECSAFSQTCTDTEFSYEMQNGCLCFDLPDPLCDPVEAGCDCTTTTTTTTTTSTTSTTTTSTTSTTTTTPPALCPAGSTGSWDFDTECAIENSPVFEARPPGAAVGCCYKVVFSFDVTYEASGSCGIGPFATIADLADPAGMWQTLGCGGTPDATLYRGPGHSVITTTRYVCDGDTFQLTAIPFSPSVPLGRFFGTVSWVITLEDPAGCP